MTTTLRTHRLGLSWTATIAFKAQSTSVILRVYFFVRVYFRSYDANWTHSQRFTFVDATVTPRKTYMIMLPVEFESTSRGWKPRMISRTTLREHCRHPELNRNLAVFSRPLSRWVITAYTSTYYRCNFVASKFEEQYFWAAKKNIFKTNPVFYNPNNFSFIVPAVYKTYRLDYELPLEVLLRF